MLLKENDQKKLELLQNKYEELILKRTKEHIKAIQLGKELARVEKQHQEYNNMAKEVLERMKELY